MRSKFSSRPFFVRYLAYTYALLSIKRIRKANVLPVFNETCPVFFHLSRVLHAIYHPVKIRHQFLQCIEAAA